MKTAVFNPDFWTEGYEPNQALAEVKITTASGVSELYDPNSLVADVTTAFRTASEDTINYNPFLEDEAIRAQIHMVCHMIENKLASSIRPETGIDSINEFALHSAIEHSLLNVGLTKQALAFQSAHNAKFTSVRRNVRVIRRNGKMVMWQRSKIAIAVAKAFLSLGQSSEPAEAVAIAVERRIRDAAKDIIDIEEIQDLVQEEIMRAGHFKVAAGYIEYRTKAAAARELDRIEKSKQPKQYERQAVKVLDDQGTEMVWSGQDLADRIRFASTGLELNISDEDIEQRLRASLFDGIDLKGLQSTILMNAKTLNEVGPNFPIFTARIRLTYLYEEVLDWTVESNEMFDLGSAHRAAFRSNLVRMAELGRVNPKLLEYDLNRLSEALDPKADLDFDFLGIQTLYDRYLIVDKSAKVHRRLETPQTFFMRVAMGLFLNEPGDREGKVVELYRMYKSRRFCSSTPTLFNSGTNHSQMSSCYLYKVDDSIDSIFSKGISENAHLSKWAGGLGGSWTAVRGTGAYIKGTNGESQGLIPFVKIHNDQLVAVNQGGKRKGSGCAYLEVWHNDIEDFLELRKNTGDDRRRCHDMNTANWIPDLFMKRMEARQSWTLFRSNEVADLHELYGKEFEARYKQYEQLAQDGKIWSKEMPAIELWKKMLKMLFETGHPWITFKDPCNLRSPQDHAGVVHSSNLCTEITLNTSADETAVCNLGSVIIDNLLDDEGNIDHKKLRTTVRIAIRALDNVIDDNFYPVEAARRSNMLHRPIGLGVMGLHNALYIKRIAFDSDEAVKFNDELMEAISYYAIEASSDLAAEKGRYESYQGSKWDRGLLPIDTVRLLEENRGVEVEMGTESTMDWNALREKVAKQGMRNSNVMAIAPTATISNIMGTSPCIEPVYKNVYVKSNLSGEFTVINRHLYRDLIERGLLTSEVVDQIKYYDGVLAEIEEIPAELKRLYKTAFEIEHTWIIKAASARQKWIDQSQSVNLFLGSPDMKTLSHMYRAAWRSGLKTTYYLRTLGASSIEKATVTKKKELRGVVAGGSATASEPEVCESCQ